MDKNTYILELVARGFATDRAENPRYLLSLAKAMAGLMEEKGYFANTTPTKHTPLVEDCVSAGDYLVTRSYKSIYRVVRWSLGCVEVATLNGQVMPVMPMRDFIVKADPAWIIEEHTTDMLNNVRRAVFVRFENDREITLKLYSHPTSEDDRPLCTYPITPFPKLP